MGVILLSALAAVAAWMLPRLSLQWRPMKGTVWDYIHSGSGKGKVTQNLLHFVANTTMTGTDKEAGAEMWFKGGCEYG